MRILLLVVLASLLVVPGSAQSQKFDGTWYGTINAPGAQFDIVFSFKKAGAGWTGTLLTENGMRLALKDVTAEGNAISFSFDPGQAKVTFKGTLSNDARVVSGELAQDGRKSPCNLSRTPSAAPQAPQSPSPAIDPNELIGMMTSVSGPLDERPFVLPLQIAPIEYGIRPSRDPVATLMRDVQDGKVHLKFEGEHGYLRSLLEALDIPVESQMAVFSKTSVQGGLINPQNPRTLYFNDSVAVGSVRGGFIELASQDPEQGMNFYMLPQEPADKPFFIKRDQCLGCHISRNSLDVPGTLVRSVYPAPNGAPINPLGSHLLDHRTRFEERWGGWYVTGSSGSMRHLGNGMVSDPGKPESMVTDKTLNVKTLKGKFDTDAYLSPYSDIVALMVFEHQMHMMNLITRVGWDFRLASSLESATGKRNETIDRQLRDAAQELVDYLLFIDETRLTDKIQGSSGFAEKFASQGPNDSKGRSLRQFDLEHRLMRYPCSYMICSPAFDALPAEAKKAIYERTWQVLSGEAKDSKYSRLSPTDRTAIVEILRDTRKDLPDYFKANQRR
jgi:hypothetical protein